MISLSEQDTIYVVNRLPRDIKKLLQARKLFLAGGFIREIIAGQMPHDIDLLAPTRGQAIDAAEVLMTNRKEEGEGQIQQIETENAITVLSVARTPVQFITRWTFDTPEACIESFDFTVCQVAIWWDDGEGRWKSLAHDDFYKDLAARRLVYTSPQREEAPGGSMLRVVKFLRRGYTIQSESLAAVMFRLASAIRENPLTDEEGGWVKVCTGLLRDVDPILAMDGWRAADERNAQ